MKNERKFVSKGYTIEVGPLQDSSLTELLAATYTESKKVIIVDENTQRFCLDFLLTHFDGFENAEIMVLPEGESNKQIEVAVGVWEALTEYGIGRHDLIVNLGGGVITDMGGFIASCYKRGCDFIAIPTTLLGMVDASIGGKTGVNLGKYKNQIGVFSNPIATYIDPTFLQTLPEKEWKSGYAEMIKHGLIANRSIFERLCANIKDNQLIDLDLLVDCLNVKWEVVQRDPLERGERKILNFGHTAGHAIEGNSMFQEPLTHGHAIAIGMLIEAYLSVEYANLSNSDFDKIERCIRQNYTIPAFSTAEIDEMVQLLFNDKKNKSGKIRCCLLPEIGVCTYDHEIPADDFRQAFHWISQPTQ